MKIRLILLLLTVLSAGGCVIENGKVNWGTAPPYEMAPWDSNR